MKHVLLFLLCCYSVFASCDDNGSTHPDGDKWVRNGNFLVTCTGNNVKVLKCLTDAGTVLELGTESHVENGVEYSCIDDEISIEGSGEEVSVNSCSDFSDASDDLTVGNFLICCISRRFKGCVDDNGDSLKTGYFVLGKGLLKFCSIKDQGWKARIEPRGCFNGTKDDDAEDTQFHVKKYTVWRQGDFDLRCGDNGIHVYRCYVEEKPLYVGSAWIDKNGIVNICK